MVNSSINVLMENHEMYALYIHMSLMDFPTEQIINNYKLARYQADAIILH